jgi:hypothetical protein
LEKDKIEIDSLLWGELVEEPLGVIAWDVGVGLEEELKVLCVDVELEGGEIFLPDYLLEDDFEVDGDVVEWLDGV